jgi:uncharacterized repeat protein (TIGR03803 family)
VIVGILAIGLSIAAEASTEYVVHAFVPFPGGGLPFATVVQASDGNLYGTTYRGGTNDLGTVYRVTDLAGTPVKTVIHSFTGGADGAYPYASLVEASNGNLYGTTSSGGVGGAGTVFSITDLAGNPTESVVHAFTGGNDGSNPMTSLIQASDGKLYGTAGGGTNGAGTVFAISNLGGTSTENVIYSFAGAPDGNGPSSALVQAADGNLYGTTQSGGSSGYGGTVFVIGNLGGTPTESIIYSFSGGADGGYPVSGLIQASDGNLYGTTQYGGSNNVGTVFEIVDPGGTPLESVIYSFMGATDGSYPQASLLQASDGNLYGATAFGGSSSVGTVFEISGLGGIATESVVYSFAGGTDGAFPYAGLIQASDGSLYGTAGQSLTSNVGTVFRISGVGGTPAFDVVVEFRGSDGAYATATLIQGSDGNLYGTTGYGGSSDFGSVLKITNPGGAVTEALVHSFTGQFTSDGANPGAQVTQASDGSLYGTTVDGGAYGWGSVFRISGLAGTPAESIVYSFAAGADGMGPEGSLIQASDGNLYGTTFYGGANNAGTVFRISGLPGTPTETIIHDFGGASDGANPAAALLQASDGNLYGTTSSGGTGYGTVFRIKDPGGASAESVVYGFAGGSDGAFPYASLIQTSSGDLYGTTYRGGPNDSGAVFRISNVGGTPVENIVYAFSGSTDGGTPFASLFEAPDGSLYGTSRDGGAAGLGTVFNIADPGGTPGESVVYSFLGGTDGANPVSSLIRTIDGNLFGITHNGGPSDVGVVFEITGLCFPGVVPITAPARVVANSTGNTASVPVTAGATYAWTIVNGTITAGAGTDTITFTAGASGTVDLSITVTASGCSSTGNQSITINPGGTVLKFFTIAPCRLIDTRRPAGTYGGPALAGGTQRDFPIDGQCGIPSDAYAVSANVTAVIPTVGGDLRAYPTGTPVPSSSIINFNPGLTRANNVLVPLTGIPIGSMTIQTDIPGGSTHFLFDVDGYFRFVP